MEQSKKSKRNPNPRDTSFFLSKVTFAYFFPTFLQGFFKDLEDDDLPEPLNEHKSELIGEQFQKYWLDEFDRATKSNVSPSMLRVIWRVFKWDILCHAIILLTAELGRVIQPLALGQLLNYFSPNSTMTKGEAYMYAAAIVVSSFTFLVFASPFRHNIQHMGMKIRIGCSSLIYRKALKMDKSVFVDTSVGKIVNILANDVSRFDKCVLFMHFFWIGPLEFIVCMYFIIEEIGVGTSAGLAFMAIIMGVQYVLAKILGKIRMKTAAATDERLRLMGEVITGIQVIKMYVWEKPFSTLVDLYRRKELKLISYSNFIRGITTSLMVYYIRAVTTFTIIAFALFNNYLTSRKVYTVTLFYNVLRTSLAIFFARGFSEIAEANVTIKRITAFLLKNDKQILTSYNDWIDLQENGLVIEHATAKWDSKAPRNTLNDVNLSIDSNGVFAFIGSVGAGKSSLFEAILQELPLVVGKIQVQGSISYASQEPWIFSSSVRQNILFTCGLDEERYKKVLRVCGLEKDIASFPYGDMTNVGVRGIKLSGGQKARISLARAVYRNADIYLLDDPLSAVDSLVGQQLFDECITEFLKNKIVLLNTHQLQYLKYTKRIFYIENGEIKRQGTFEELNDLEFIKILSETSFNKSKTKSKDNLCSMQSSSNYNSLQSVPLNKEMKSTGSVSNNVYGSYLKNGGNIFTQILIYFTFFLVSLLGIMSDYFLSLWVNVEEDYLLRMEYQNSSINGTLVSEVSYIDLFGYTACLTRNDFIIIYGVILAVLMIASIINSFGFSAFTMKASQNLHDLMFNTIIRAPLRFFAINNSGQIFNRFSKDLGTVDDVLPITLMDTMNIFLFVLGTLILVCVVNYWMIIPSIILIILNYLIRMIYLRTSTSLKRLDGTTKSPMFGHVNTSLKGLTTIRCFNAESILIREFDLHQDLHSSASFTFLTAAVALTYVLELLNFTYITLVTFSFLVFTTNESGGNVGLAITQVLMTTGLIQWGFRQSTEMENNMTSVERILEYSAIETERSAESEEDKLPPRSWPDKGQIEFINVSLRYAAEEPVILHNITFTVQQQEKIAVIGRTGAGKSSLANALFQLAPIEGKIIIDGIDITKIGLHDLRKKISIIPQDPTLYSGTIRKNLDPFHEFNDIEIWQALEDVDLKKKITILEGGLDFHVTEGASNFSVGEKQLFCLARAILRKNRILVLDEATANVDLQTDNLIQKTVRQKFAKCTVLTIAHRLSTIMDYDKILVLDEGLIREFGHPHELLQNHSGYFYEMLH